MVRITPANAGLLARIAEDVFDAEPDPARLAAYLADPATLLVVAIDGGLVVGQAQGTRQRHPDKADELYIGNLGVSPEWQRRGIASRLLAALMAEGRALGCGAAWVVTEAGNTPARALYARLGPGQDCVVYELAPGD